MMMMTRSSRSCAPAPRHNLSLVSAGGCERDEARCGARVSPESSTRFAAVCSRGRELGGSFREVRLTHRAAARVISSLL